MSKEPKKEETEGKEIPVDEIFDSFMASIQNDPDSEKYKKFIDPEALKQQIEKEFEYYNGKNKNALQIDMENLIKKESNEKVEELFQVDEDVSMCFLVDNLPISKNIKILEKTFRKRIVGLLKVKNDQIYNVHFPFEKKKTKGFAFFELRNLEKQKNSYRYVVSKMQSKPLVKKRPNRYIMKIYSLKDMKKYDNFDASKFQYKKRKFYPEENLYTWICDKDGRDQMVVRDDKGVAIQWFDGNQQSIEVVSLFDEKHWLEDEVRWSPFGTYLVTYNKQELSFELYGTKKGQQGGVCKLKTIKLEGDLESSTLVGSQSFQFTPAETFFCVHDKVKDMMVYLIYDVRSSELVHTLRYNEQAKGSFVIKWSPKDDFVAVMNKGKIKILETSSFQEIGKVSEKGVTGFEWSPTDSSFVYYTQEVEETVKKAIVEDLSMQDERYFDEVAYLQQQQQKQLLKQRNVEMVVYYVSIPSFKVVKSKVYHEPYDLRVFWHPDGLYFATVVEDRQFKQDRLVKIISSIDVYRLKEKGLPVDNLVIHQKVDDLHWEPNNGSKFILLCSTPSTEIINPMMMMQYSYNQPDENAKKATKSMFLYRIEEAHYRLMKSSLLSDKDSSFIDWSPQGRFFMLGVIGSDHRSNYHIYDTHPVVEETGKFSHFAATSQNWDPSGRYYMIATTREGSIHENNGFLIWDIAGKQVIEKKFLVLRQVMWRKKPKNLLNARLIKKLQSPSNVRKFARMEKQKAQSRRKDLEDKFRREFEDFVSFRKDYSKNFNLEEFMLSRVEFVDLKEELDVTLEEKSEILD